MASIAKQWLMCGYFNLTILFICSKTTFNFHKGTYVIKTLCNWVQIWTWVILADADITEATLNSLSDLALDFIIVIYFFAGRKTFKMHTVRASTVIHVGQNTQGNTLLKNIIVNHRRSHSDRISFLRGSLSFMKNSR